MYTLIVILILLVCLMLAGVVLVQNSKGGGLAANFSAPNGILGVRRTADFLEKATWWLAAILIVLSLAATVAIPRHTVEKEVDTKVSTIEHPVTNTPAPTTEQPVQE